MSLMKTFYCGKKGCNGHYTKGEVCREILGFETKDNLYYCFPKCPGHVGKGRCKDYKEKTI